MGERVREIRFISHPSSMPAYDFSKMLITLQSHICNRDYMFDRDWILDELDSFHHQAKNLLLRFKARVIERCADITTKLLDCRGQCGLTLLSLSLLFE